MKNSIFKGSLLVFFGASCYGMLGVYVKKAYQSGYTTAEVTIAQFALGFVALFLLNLVRKPKPEIKNNPISFGSKLKLVFAGTSLGLTSIFYYMAVKYIPVSVCIVLLMQTVWMGIVLEMLIYKAYPGWRKVMSALVVIIGSILATNLMEQSVVINWKGILFGMMSAVCYTATMYSTKNIQPLHPPHKRSLYMISGGLCVIAIVFHSSISAGFSYGIFFSWGLLVSLFGTVIPPLLFNAGMPLTGIGLGAVVASVEIPVAILAANFLLKEQVNPLQWTGVILILIAVVAMNFSKQTQQKMDSAKLMPD